jgi:high-affinity Fe2+/Pb2+ permease
MNRKKAANIVTAVIIAGVLTFFIWHYIRNREYGQEFLIFGLLGLFVLFDAIKGIFKKNSNN